MSLKGEIFVNFLPQKFMTKYGIVSTYFVTFVSLKKYHILPPFLGLKSAGIITHIFKFFWSIFLIGKF